MQRSLKQLVPAPVGRAFRAAGRFARAAGDKVPLTPLGALLTLAAGLAVDELGRKRQDIVLYVAGLGALAAIAVAVLFVAVSTIVLLVRVRPIARMHARFEAAQPVETGFSLPSLGPVPLLLVGWSWLEPEAVAVEEPARARGRMREKVVFHERGEHRRTVRRIVVEDVLGLARLAFRLVEETPRTVYPALGRPLTVPLLQAFASGDNISHPAGPPDGDLIEMRRYAMGDPMKRILWKTYARSRDLMVRTPERAISPTLRTLAYLIAAEGDEAAAGVARLALEGDALGPEWRFSCDLPGGEQEDATDPRRAVELVVRSRGAWGRGGEGLGSFLERAATWGGSRCVIFAPARRGPWLGFVEEQARLRPGHVEVVIGIDGVRDAGPASRWRRTFLVDEDAGDDMHARTRGRADEVDEMTRRLAACGATVTVADRPTGKIFGRAGRRRRA
jgi:hypothetical protein